MLLPGGLVQALEQLIKISIITVTPGTGRLWGGTPLTERGAERNRHGHGPAMALAPGGSRAALLEAGACGRNAVPACRKGLQGERVLRLETPGRHSADIFCSQ